MSSIIRKSLVVVALVWMPAAAFGQARTSVEGFGGLSVTTIQSPTPSLGAKLTFEAAPGIQLFGEAGRLGNVLPTLSGAVFSLARLDLRASALYGEGGIRFLPAPNAIATPYVEATAGVSRLTVTSGRLAPVANAAASIALGFAGRTAPIVGVGGGALLRAGPIVLDVGYRYKQLFASEVMQGLLGLGQPLRTHQFRAGIGVRF